MMSAALVGMSKWGRTLLVQCGESTFVVRYSPWGFNTECVYVDGAVAVRRAGGYKMSHRYRFLLGDQMAELSVALPWWGEYVRLGDLSFFRLEVAGTLLYREGRPPRGPLPCTTAAVGFPVVACDDPPPLAEPAEPAAVMAEQGL